MPLFLSQQPPPQPLLQPIETNDNVPLLKNSETHHSHNSNNSNININSGKKEKSEKETKEKEKKKERKKELMLAKKNIERKVCFLIFLFFLWV